MNLNAPDRSPAAKASWQSPSSNYRRVNLIILAVLCLAAIGLLLPVTIHSISVRSDHLPHLAFAQELLAQGVPGTPHFLYHGLALLVYILTGQADWYKALVFTNLLGHLLTVFALFLALRGPKSRGNVLQGLICAGLALGLVIMVPPFPIVELFYSQYHPQLVGYLTPLVYHNPTLIILRPFALFLFLLIEQYVLSERAGGRGGQMLRRGLLAAGVTILAGLAKPNYLIAMLPALGVWMVWRLWRRLPVGWRLGVSGMLLPGLLLLVWQYNYTYINPTAQLTESQIIFAPFETVLQVSGGLYDLVAARFFVSILLPVIVYGVFWRKALQDQALNFAWLSFVIGAAYFYLFAESGERLGHGNFLWSAYITIFILHVASVRFALHQWHARRTNGRLMIDWRFGLTASVFALYVWSGWRYISLISDWFLFRT